MNIGKKKQLKAGIDKYSDNIKSKKEDVIKSKKKKEIRKVKIGRVVKEILSEEECNVLLQVCDKSKHSLENNFLVQTMLVIGFRIGEVVHFKKSWVNFEEKTIRIPPHDPCCCNYCFQRLKQQLKTRGESKEEQNLISKEEVMKYYWQPKTEAGVRVVYYGFDAGYEYILKEFFSKYSQWPHSLYTARERIGKMLYLANLKYHIPHHLRKTAASNYAARGFTEQYLMAVMGWDDIQVAQVYIRLYGPRSVEAQKRILGAEKKKFLSMIQESSFI